MIRIGAIFSEERKRKNLTLEEISKATKIREEFLAAIEKGDFKALPSSAYAYGFVRNYAKFLGLPVEKSLALFRREFDEKKNIEVLPKGFSNPREYSAPRFRIGKSMILVGLIFFAVVAFLIFQYRAAIFNPGLSVEYPLENQTVNSVNIEVRGKTDPNSTLSIDNKDVSVESDGTFKKVITAFPGNTVINIRAENKLGRVTILKRSIKVLPSE